MQDNFTQKITIIEKIKTSKNEIRKCQNIISNLEYQNNKYLEELGKIEFEKFEDSNSYRPLKFVYFEKEKKLIYGGSIFKDTAKVKINEYIKNKLLSKTNGGYKTYWDNQKKLWKIENIEREEIPRVSNIIKEYLKKYIDEMDIDYV